MPDIRRKLYPFKDIALSRADVEWLLATYKDSLDFHGADLHETNLHGLPLARVNLSEAHLERVDLQWAHLEGAYLSGAYLQEANLRWAHLEETHLSRAHLEGAKLAEAHLERTGLQWTHLGGADLSGAHLEGANLSNAHLEEANLSKAHLEGAYLSGAHLEGAFLNETYLGGADLRESFFDSATQLINIALKDEKLGFVSLADVRWGDTNMAVVNWSSVKVLGDESKAQQQRNDDSETELYWYRRAVRANRQLAVVLRDQGLNEEADYFSYRAQMLQRVVWRLRRRPLKFVLSWFLFLLAGYGYRPLRSVLWYLVIIIGFALAYHTFGHLSLWPPDAFVYSLTSFHGRGFFPGLEHRTSLHDPLVMLAALEAVVGLLIEISFIATFTQRFFGK